MNDLVASLPRSVGRALYADDIAVWKGAPTCDANLQKAVSAVCSWASANAMELSKGKTQAILLSRSRRRKALPRASWLPLWEDGEQLPEVAQATYLGLVFDRRLAWTPHLQALVRRARGLLYPIVELGKGPRGISLADCIHLYKACVASLWDQTLPLLAMATKSDLNALQLQQNKALRRISGMPPNTNIEELHSALGVATIEQRLNTRSAKLLNISLGNGLPSPAAKSWAVHSLATKRHVSPLSKAWDLHGASSSHVVPLLQREDFWRAELGGYPTLGRTDVTGPPQRPFPVYGRDAMPRLWTALRGPVPALLPREVWRRATKGKLCYLDGGPQHFASLLSGQPLLRGALGLTETNIDAASDVEFPVLRRACDASKGPPQLGFFRRKLPPSPSADTPPRKMVWLFADGACDPATGDGAAGVWSAGFHKPTSLGMRAGKGWTPRGVELLALLLALACACDQLDDARERAHVGLASDCQSAVHILCGKRRPADDWERAIVAEFHGIIALTGLCPTLRWVPRTHEGIKYAHARAQKAKDHGVAAFDRPSKRHFPKLPPPCLCTLNKYEAAPLLRVLLNKGDLNWDLWRRGKTRLPHCDLCGGEPPQDVLHITFDCSSLHMERNALLRWFERRGLPASQTSLARLQRGDALSLRPLLAGLVFSARRLKDAW